MKEKKVMRNKWVITAASIMLILAIGFLLSRIKDSLTTGLILDVEYPKAYAFEDFDARRDIREQNPMPDNFILAINDFTFRTGSLILNDAGENTNYSPLSLYYSLALAATGAENETEAELLTLLGVNDHQELLEQSGNLYRYIYKDNEVGKLKIANSIWLADNINGEKIHFKENFIKQAAESFYASSHSVDFADKKTGEAMAEWISTNTNGTLSPTIETDPDQILSILNTVYFYDEWLYGFDKSETKEDIFYLSDGSEVRTDFMSQISGSGVFTRGGYWTRSYLSLKNGGHMIFILPHEGVSPYEIISSPEQMMQAFGGGVRFMGEVTWKIPKFNFSSKFELVDVLKRVGVNSAFTSDADFSGITDHVAFISNIVQETHISLDEDGVEASAFTQIDYTTGGLVAGDSIDMILNRPFIYGIEADDGSLLFIGVCENPAD